MRKLFFVAKVILAVFICYKVVVFCEKKTDGFSILAISSSRPYHHEWATRPLQDQERAELFEAIHQKYKYYGCGGQAYAFFSEDGKYVVKFFKQKLFRPPTWLSYIPIPYLLNKYRAKKTWKRADKLERDYGSYKTGFDELQEETGLIFVHLNKTKDLNTKLQIIDKLGIEHHLDLDKMDFVVQKRAELIYDRFATFMRVGDIRGAKELTHEVFHLILSRCQKGFRDRDPNIRTNCGYLHGRVIKIDVGRFVPDVEIKKRAAYEKELLRICQPFKEWIAINHPSFIPEYEKEFIAVLNQSN